VNEALEAMTAMAKRTEEEARLEGLITAKGFQDCVAYMTDNNVTVTVSAGAEGLSEAGVARIKDIILTETDYNANQMKIVEVK
jgi:stage III sporulation protein AH